MGRNDRYMDLDGNVISLANLDREERRLVNRLLRRARLKPDWGDFDAFTSWVEAGEPAPPPADLSAVTAYFRAGREAAR